MSNFVVVVSRRRKVADTLHDIGVVTVVVTARGSREVELAYYATLPLHADFGRALGYIDRMQSHGFDDQTEHGLAIGHAGRRGPPDGGKISGELPDPAPVFCRECNVTLPSRFGMPLLDCFEILEALLPFTLERARHDSVVGIDRLVPPLCPTCFVLRLFDASAPCFVERIS